MRWCDSLGIYIYIYHGPPKPTCLEMFMVKNLVFRWPKALFSMGFGGSWYITLHPWNLTFVEPTRRSKASTIPIKEPVGTGIFTLIYHKHQPVSKYTIHGSSGIFWDISVQYFFAGEMRYPLQSKQIKLHKNKSLTWEDNHISLYVGDIVECHFLHGVPDPSSGASLPENADASDPLLAQTFSSVAVQQWLQPFSDFLQWLSAHLDLLTTFLGGTIDPDRLLDADPKVALSQPCGTTLWKLTSGGIPSRRSLRTSGLCLTMWWNARINPPDNLRSCTNVMKQCLLKCPDGRIITIVSKLAYFTSLRGVRQPAYIVVVILIHLPFVPAGHPSSS